MTAKRRLRVWTAAGAAGLLAAALGLAVLLTGYSLNTLDDDTLLTDRVRASEVQRGELHLLGTPPATDHVLLERVMALGGDRITCRAGHVTLNGRPVSGTCSREVDVDVPSGKALVEDRQGTATVDLAQLGDRVVWHTGKAPETPPLPGKLTGALIWIGIGAAAAVLAAVELARRKPAPARV
ncbi:S26 family signal peptidase [Kitasatospora sp. NPDC048722]|uniref:S26 family signal peptidase n=1 Tax=Kitasatospora sp. NPDC048722 TaxID=3155639 RepID=UPI0033E131D8